jgi:MFS superfamily sulfate permease-like transporter/carbonic anhydrase
MKQLREGAQRFSRHVFPFKKELFHELSKGQSPEVLFITCADSRIDPQLITQQQPGRLFVMRNAGNIVPPAGTPISGEQSTIEFAVTAVKVKHVVVCGHSSCGAMSGLLDNNKLQPLPMVAEWLHYADELKNRLPADVTVDQAARANVLLQLEHLRQQPAIEAAVARGELSLHGWFYDIGTGLFEEYDEQLGQFVELGSPAELFGGTTTEAAPHEVAETVAPALPWFDLSAWWRHHKPFLRDDLVASIVVFLVALPLCLGIANASGVPSTAALITGIIGGLVVGLITGAPLQVSGPAAGLIVIVSDMLRDFRLHYLNERGIDLADTAAVAQIENELTSFVMAGLGLTVLCGGLVQLLAGYFKLGQWFRAVSPAVIEGMLSGIGILILASQFHVMLDDPKRGDGLENLLSIPEAIYNGFSNESYSHEIAAATGVITIAVIVLWSKFAPKALSFLPPALVAVVVATLFAESLQNFAPSKLEIPDNIFANLYWPSPVWVDMLTSPSILQIAATNAIVIALVASAETLLCSTAVDKLHNGPRTKYDREMVAQGVGNSLCGLVGGLPMTGVIVRSSANVRSGGKTNLSTVLHGMWLLVFVATMPWLLRYIPLSCLGGLLVYTGYKLVNVKNARKLWVTGKVQFFIYLATIIAIVATDLLKGVIFGIALAAIHLLWKFSHLEINVDRLSPKHVVIRLSGAATFLRLPYLAETLESMPADAALNLDLEHLEHIDHACLELLADWAQQHEAAGGVIEIDWGAIDASFRQSPGERFARLRNRV